MWMYKCSAQKRHNKIQIDLSTWSPHEKRKWQNGGVRYNRSPVNGRYPVDTVAYLSCNYGYSRSGSSSRTCQTSGTWNLDTPTCNQSNEVTFVLSVILPGQPLPFTVRFYPFTFECVINSVPWNPCSSLEFQTLGDMAIWSAVMALALKTKRGLFSANN